MTTTGTWGVNPLYVPVKHDDVRSAVELMRLLGIRRLAFNGLEIEIGDAPRQIVDVGEPVAQQGVFEDATGSVCACGHSWITEHADAGCLMGCSHDLCSSSGGAPNVG